MKACCLLFSALALLAAPAAGFELSGVVETFGHEVLVDSASLTDAGGTTEVFPTAGWGGPPATVDTFDFPTQPGWPIEVVLYLRVDGGQTVEEFLGAPTPGEWTTLTDSTGRVLFYVRTGITERPGTGLPALALAVRPSVVTGRAVFGLRLSGSDPARLELFDAAGNPVRVFAVGAGTRALTWDGADESGRQAAEGVYFCCLTCQGRAVVRKLLKAR
jgi:YD repeat-containing protein